MMAGHSPFQDLASGPMDVRLVEVKPGASQDDVCGGFLQHHERDVFFVQESHAEDDCGGEIVDTTLAQRLSLYGGYFEFDRASVMFGVETS